MNLIHLRYFVELSRTGSYTQAARRLCITQPMITEYLKGRIATAYKPLLICTLTFYVILR